jgi:excisionase family DNA binding protein
MGSNSNVAMLIPFAPEEFWAEFRRIIKEELVASEPATVAGDPGLIVEPQFAGKTLYKISEVCALFNVSRMTVHEWVKTGKLRKIKVRSRVYFLSSEVYDIIRKPQ